MTIWMLIYNIIIVPLGIFIVSLFSLFNEKLKKGVKGRKKSWKKLKNFRKINPNEEIFLIHSASLGEFEQAKPVIRGLKTIRPDITIVVTFASPSGYENAERMNEVALLLYLPVDSFFRMKRFLNILKPKKIIFVTYELWPNFIINAMKKKIPTYLMSARIRENSKKWLFPTRGFFRYLYKSVDYIFTVSENDKKVLEKLIGEKDIRVLHLGDTRYDQVIERAKKRINKHIPKLFEDGFVFVAGSVWPADVRHLLPALIKVYKSNKDFCIVMAPHEPSEYALETLEDTFDQNEISTLRYSNIGNKNNSNRVILIDRIGILAEIYHQSNMAFLGGSFKGAIHNVMEPAVAGIPVLFGPDYHNSREAELLISDGGGRCCQSSDEFFDVITNLIKNEQLYKEVSEASRQVIIKNLGASAKTVKEILESY